MSEENRQLYYYHGDHLGSAQLVTDPEGKIYEQLEYTPYGELWVEHVPVVEATPFRFTGKERDGETGLYYFGARYLNPQTGMWLSADPAMGEYIPQAPINDEAKQHNKELPGMGGVFNYVNLHVYHYAGNNPVRYIDPTGSIFTPDSPWDFANAFLGYWCAYIAFSSEGTGSVDGWISLGGAVADTIAGIAPVIPGGATIAIKTAQYGSAGYSAIKNIVLGVKDKNRLQLAIGVFQVLGIALGPAGSKYLQYADDAAQRISKLPRSMIYGAMAAGLKDEHIGVFFKMMASLGVSGDTIRQSALEYSTVAKDMKNLQAILNYRSEDGRSITPQPGPGGILPGSPPPRPEPYKGPGSSWQFIQ